MDVREFISKYSVNNTLYVMACFPDRCALGNCNDGQIQWAKEVKEAEMTELYLFNQSQQHHAVINHGQVVGEEHIVDDDRIVVIDKDSSTSQIIDIIYENPEAVFAYDDYFYVTGNERHPFIDNALIQQGRVVELPTLTGIDYDLAKNPLRLQVRNYIEQQEINGIRQTVVIRNRIVGFTAERR